MKKTTVLVLFMVASMLSFAQEKITEGTIITKMSISSLDPQYEKEVGVLADQLTLISFKKDKSRSEVSSRRTGLKTSIVDLTKNKKLVLTDNLITGKRFRFEDLDATRKKATVTKLKDTKIVKGYTCQHYQIRSLSKEDEIIIDVYTTPKVGAISLEVAAFYNQTKGFPMYMEMRVKSHGMHLLMQYEVTELKAESVADSQFLIKIPEGFTKYSPTVLARQSSTK